MAILQRSDSLHVWGVESASRPRPALALRQWPLSSPGLFGSAVLRYERPIGQSTFRVRVLPARAGYLTKPDDTCGVVEAIREASTRWAGFSEPIIPVPAAGVVDGWWVQTLKTAEVDGLVNVNIDVDVAERVAKTLGLPVVNLADIDRSGRTQFSTHPANLQQTRLQFADQAAVLARADGALWEKTAAGDLTAEQKADCEDASIPVWRPETADLIGRAQLDETCWLDVGAAHFAEHRIVGGPFAAPAIVWVTEPDSVADCVYFWNLRALRSRRLRPAPMLLIPAEQIFHWTGFADALAYRLSRPEDIEPDVVLNSLSVGPDQLDEIAGLLGLIESTEPLRGNMQFPPLPLKRAPFTYRRDIAPRTYFHSPRRYGETAQTLVQVYRDSTVAEVDSPVQFTGGGRALVRVASSAFDGLPKRPTTASLIMKDASWSEDELEYATYAQNRYRLELRVPTLSEAAWALLKNRTAQAALSTKGQLAHRLNELGAAEALLQDSVIQVIESLRTRRSQDLERALQRVLEHVSPTDELRTRLEALASEWGQRSKRRFLPISEIKGLGENTGSAVERLCFRSWAERGLKIRCGQCRIRSFVPLPETTPEPQCPACGATNTRFEPAGGGPEMHYRLNARVDRAADQGIIPHLFADAVLTAEDPQTFLLQGVDVTFEDGRKKEVDLYGITRGKVVAGEAKTSPAEFTPEQLASDIKLSVALAADTHLMVSTGEIPRTTKKQARQLAEAQGLDLRLIDSRQRAARSAQPTSSPTNG